MWLELAEEKGHEWREMRERFEVRGEEHATMEGPDILRMEGDQWGFTWEGTGVLSGSHRECEWEAERGWKEGSRGARWQFAARQKAVVPRSEGLPSKRHVIYEVHIAE